MQHCENLGVPTKNLKVMICDDQTSLVNRLEFNSKSGGITGFKPDLDKQTGFPNQNFTAESLTIVKHYFDNIKKSKYVHAFVAVALHPNATPFILAIFGSDNVYSSLDVQNR